MLGLRSRGTLYRKIESGELPSEMGRDGKRRVEREGLEERWLQVVREKVSSSPMVPPVSAPPPAVVALPSSQPQARSAPPPATQERPVQAPPAHVARPRRGRPPGSRASVAVVPEDDVPDYNQERALHEREKRLLAELARMEKEGELVYREDIEAAQSAINLQILNRAEALPKQIKMDIPHLTIEEMTIIERRVIEVFEAVANHDFSELEGEDD